MEVGSLRRIVLRPDVRLHIRGNHVYVCSSYSTLRFKRFDAGNDLLSAEGAAGALTPQRSLLDEFPPEAVAELAGRGMVRQAGQNDDDLEDLPPVSFTATPASPVQVAGEGRLSALIAHQVRRAGMNVLHRVSPVDRPTSACVLSLDLDQVVLPALDQLRDPAAVAAGHVRAIPQPTASDGPAATADPMPSLR